jgi:hypothetical protein
MCQQNTIETRSPARLIVAGHFRWTAMAEYNSQPSARRTLSTNWTNSFLSMTGSLPMGFSSSALIILSSILYHLLINYSLLSTVLASNRCSWMLVSNVLSRLCLIITRLYAFIFLLRLNTWWLPLTFIMLHILLMMTLWFDQWRYSHKRDNAFVQLIFSLISPHSVDDRSIHALISLENISVFLHRLYLETFALSHQNTVRLIIFLTVLTSLQILGCVMDLLARSILTRSVPRQSKI